MIKGNRSLKCDISADDISALSHTVTGIQEKTNNIETFGAKIGLRISRTKP